MNNETQRKIEEDNMKHTLEYIKTLKAMAAVLGITYYQVRKLRDKIEAKYPGVPSYMIWGGKGYHVESFKA